MQGFVVVWIWRAIGVKRMGRVEGGVLGVVRLRVEAEDGCGIVRVAGIERGLEVRDSRGRDA
jgi:hypothetical protein